MLRAVKVFPYTVGLAELCVVDDPCFQKVQDSEADKLHAIHHQRPGSLNLILPLRDDLTDFYNRFLPLLLRTDLGPLADRMNHILKSNAV